MTMGAGKPDDREAIRTLIGRAARFLDDGRFADFIGLFSDDGHYVLEADSDEIGRRMTWLDMPRDELAALLEESPQHVHDLASRKHMVSVEEIRFSDDGAEAQTLSGFSVFRTDIDGRSEVYAVGDYKDTLHRNGDDWRITTRRVVVQTRMFRTPTPTPL